MENGLHLLVDAEYTYMNQGISAMALSMMVAFNRYRERTCNIYEVSSNLFRSSPLLTLNTITSLKPIPSMYLELSFDIRTRPVVWNTYQCYLKAALSTISSELAVVEGFGRSFGAKIVRGAYMDKERKLARERGYEDPVNETYEATGEMYNRVINVSILNIYNYTNCIPLIFH